MGEKQLVIAVEGTVAMGPYWKTVISDYLEKIVRSFSGNDSIGQKTPAPSLHLGLVVFYTHDSYNGCLVQRSRWTWDIDIFFQWLSALSFGGGGGGFNDAAIAEGLSEALMMLYPQKANQTQQYLEGQRHCILVAASNPCPLPTPVYRPLLQKMEQTECTETQTDNQLSDAETIARSFGLCSVSLSVICPKQLPKLKEIFNAGKCNPRTNPPLDIAKNPSFLVLLSENLMEGCNALGLPGMQNVAITESPVKMDVSAIQPVSLLLSTSKPTANCSIRPVTVGNISSASMKVEPPTVTSLAGPVFPHMSYVPRPSTPPVASVQTSPLSSSKDMVSPPESVRDMKPIVSTMAQTMDNADPAAANVRILNDVARQAPDGSSSIMPPGMPQPLQIGMQQLGVSNSTSANMSIDQQNSITLQSVRSKYVKVWEGNFFGQRRGQPVFITRLEGYRKGSASQSLAENWPSTMQIVRLISEDHMNNKNYVEQEDFLVFRAMNKHGFLGQLQEKKLCAVIQLPSQTLLLSVSDKAGRYRRLIGMLLPADMVQFRPTISNQQQSMPQLQQQPHIPELQRRQQQQTQQLSQLQRQLSQLQLQQHHQLISHMQQQQPIMQLQKQQQIPQFQQQQQQQSMPQLHHNSLIFQKYSSNNPSNLVSSSNSTSIN